MSLSGVGLFRVEVSHFNIFPGTESGISSFRVRCGILTFCPEREGGSRGRGVERLESANGALEWKPSSGSSTQSGHRYIAPASFTPTYDLDGNLTDDGEWSY
jgi:hypothetical protein